MYECGSMCTCVYTYLILYVHSILMICGNFISILHCLLPQIPVTANSESPPAGHAARKDPTPQPPPVTVTTTTTTPGQPNMSYASQLSSEIVVSEYVWLCYWYTYPVWGVVTISIFQDSLWSHAWKPIMILHMHAPEIYGKWHMLKLYCILQNRHGYLYRKRIFDNAGKKYVLLLIVCGLNCASVQGKP